MNRFITKLIPLAALLVLPMLAQAQDTGSAMRGRVLDESGAAVAGASIVIEDLRTGSQRRLQSNASGTFLAVNLAVGGPYRVTVDGTQTIEIAAISLGDTYNLTINMREAIEEIVAIGQQSEVIETAPGPSATFDLGLLESAVAFNRDIKDVYSSDPRLNLDGFQTNCAGKHPRFNSITLDGVSHNDRMGLNTNGYSTATGMPFPFDAVQQVSVELAPFDASYGGFSACNINAVTKSGSNEWEANVFYQWTDQSLINDELDGRDLSATEPYKEEQQGFSVGGPIVKDKLFFFAAYEETEAPRFLAHGPAGSSNGDERDWITQADLDRIIAAAQSVYGFDPGEFAKNGAQTTENYLVRLDWNISDQHNLALIYNFYDGIQLRGSDSDSNEFEFANHHYNKGSKSETYTAILDSQWTDSFFTQLYYSDSRMDDTQITVGPKDVGDYQIHMDGFDFFVYMGADDSRQANSLYTDSNFIKISGQFLTGNHAISFGIESDELELFNIFVPHSNGGEWDFRDSSFGGNDPACNALTNQERFDNTEVTGGDGLPFECDPTGIDVFELGRPYQVYYGSGGGTNIATDAAALFTNKQNAVFVQDEIYFADQDLTLTAGLRYEWFTSSDDPTFNAALSTAAGFDNDHGVDGIDAVMPRIGVTWGIRDDLTLRGGLGLYSGGNPNVWLANAWSRDGITNVQDSITYRSNTLLADIPLTQTSGGGMVPTELFQIVADVDADNGSIRGTNLIDPNYKQPTETKLALGGTWDLPWGDISMDFDYMYTKLKDGAFYIDVSQEQVGTTNAGTPIYAFRDGAGEENLMLTNAGDDSESHIVSLIFNKNFDWGLDLMVGYAYTDAEDVSPMPSFTAATSWGNVATNDIGKVVAATSNYQTRDRLTLRASFAREFFGDNTTRFTLMGYYSSGQPNTYTMDSTDGLIGGTFFGSLLYIPDGPSDPNVVYTSSFDQDAFFAWIDRKGLKPGFTRRNQLESRTNSRIDLRIDQEIPLGVDDLKARAYVKIYNFTNMLNDDWGRVHDSQFFTTNVVSLAEFDPDDPDPAEQPIINGAFNYNDFSDKSISDRQTFSSIWELRLGLEINFN